MDRRRQVISASVAAATRDWLYQLVAEVQAETTLEIRPGTILDAGLPLLSKAAIMQAMGITPQSAREASNGR